jgi:pyruvate,orthophosphate dikinase
MTMRLEPEQLDQLLHPTFDPQEKAKVVILTQGIDASPGAAAGEVVFSAPRARELLEENPQAELILVRPETTPDDIAGITASQGILTSRGGKTSHAAVVARGWGKPCVVGAEQIVISEPEKCFSVNNQTVREGDWISIDGATGEVMLGKVKKMPSDIVRGLVDRDKEAQKSALYQYYVRFMALLHRKLEMWSNADYPKDARAARALGAQGIGLVRTEHMFFEEKRVFLVQQMLLSAILGNTGVTKESIKGILPLQRGDFKGIFESMDGLPITIRLLDPPVHEFLPRVDEAAKISQLAAALDAPVEKLTETILGLHEENPMLGHRGVRLLITAPAIARMQVEAIIEAAIEASQEGVWLNPRLWCL